MAHLTVSLIVIAMLVVHTLTWPYKKKLHTAIQYAIHAIQCYLLPVPTSAGRTQIV